MQSASKQPEVIATTGHFQVQEGQGAALQAARSGIIEVYHLKDAQIDDIRKIFQKPPAVDMSVYRCTPTLGFSATTLSASSRNATYLTLFRPSLTIPPHFLPLHWADPILAPPWVAQTPTAKSRAATLSPIPPSKISDLRTKGIIVEHQTAAGAEPLKRKLTMDDKAISVSFAESASKAGKGDTARRPSALCQRCSAPTDFILFSRLDASAGKCRGAARQLRHRDSTQRARGGIGNRRGT